MSDKACNLEAFTHDRVAVVFLAYVWAYEFVQLYTTCGLVRRFQIRLLRRFQHIVRRKFVCSFVVTYTMSLGITISGPQFSNLILCIQEGVRTYTGDDERRFCYTGGHLKVQVKKRTKVSVLSASAERRVCSSGNRGPG